jgi:hypothetical protein
MFQSLAADPDSFFLAFVAFVIFPYCDCPCPKERFDRERFFLRSSLTRDRRPFSRKVAPPINVRTIKVSLNPCEKSAVICPSFLALL